MNALMIILVAAAAQAQQKSNLYTKPAIKTEMPLPEQSRPPGKKNPTKHNTSSGGGNLNSEVLVLNSSFRGEGNPVIVATNFRPLGIKNLKIGDVISASIPESVFAFADSKVPVRAKVTRGELKGAIFLGEASLEKNSKRIVIDFKKFRLERGRENFSIAASALDAKGILGIEGILVSHESKFFAGQFLTAGAAAYADASIERQQNVFGNSVEVQNVDTLGKKALSSALAKTADRFGEKIKNAAEYSSLEGPIEIQLIITEQPKLTE